MDITKKYNTNFIYLRFKMLSGIEDSSISKNVDKRINSSFIIELAKDNFFNFIDDDNMLHTIQNNFEDKKQIFVIGNYLLIELDKLQITDRS